MFAPSAAETGTTRIFPFSAGFFSAVSLRKMRVLTTVFRGSPSCTHSPMNISSVNTISGRGFAPRT